MVNMPILMRTNKTLSAAGRCSMRITHEIIMDPLDADPGIFAIYEA